MPPAPARDDAAPALSDSAGATSLGLDELRGLLLGHDDQQIARLLDWINDPGQRAAEISDVLPRALRLRPAGDPQLGEALTPTMAAAIEELVRRDPESVARTLAPVIGQAIAFSLRRRLRRALRTTRYALSLRGLRWRWQARCSRTSFAEIVDRNTLIFRIEHLALYHRSSGILLLQIDHPEAHDPSGELSRTVRSLHQMLGARARDDEDGERHYSSAYKVAIEQGTQLLAAAVVRGQAPQTLRDRLLAAVDAIQQERRLALRRFNGDPSPFELSRGVLSRCLDAERSAAR